MRILGIELENIGTHKNTRIEFEERGLNILYGPNGTGKSTVLKAIGFCLFDYNPARGRKYSDFFLRKTEGEKRVKSGRITVTVADNSGKIYRITRKIGRSTSGSGFKVEEFKNGTFTELKGLSYKSKDIKEWLKKLMGIDPYSDPSVIFKIAVGTPQGTFTAPFLETGSVREEIFSKVLNIDVYSKVYENMREIVKFFEGKIAEIEKRISYLEGRMAELVKAESLLAEKQIELGILNDRLTVLKKELFENEKEYKILDETAEKIRNIDSNLREFTARKKGIESNIRTLRKNLEDAENARKEIKEIEPQYRHYLEIRGEIGRLDKLEKEIGIKKEKIHKLEKELESIDTAIKYIKEEISEIEKVIKKIPELKKIYDEFETLRVKKERLKEQKGKLEEKEKRLKKLEEELDKLSDLEKRIKQIESKIVRFRELREKKELLADKIGKLEIEIGELNKLEDTLKEYSSKLEVGKCPFFGEDCPLLTSEEGEDKGLSITEQLRRIEVRKKVISEKLTELRKMLDKIDKARPDERLEKLRTELGGLTQKYNQKEAWIRESEEIRKELDKKDEIIKEINRIEKRLSEIGKERDAYTEAVNRKKELPGKKKRLDSHLRKKDVITDEIRKIKEEIKGPEKELEKKEDLKKEMDELEPVYKKYIQQRKIAEKYVAVKKEYDGEVKKLRELEKEIVKAAEELTRYRKEFDSDRYTILEKKVKELRSETSKLEGEIKGVKKYIRKLEKEAEEYKVSVKEREKLKSKLDYYQNILEFVKKIRDIFNTATPKLIGALNNHIESNATEIFGRLTDRTDTEIILDQNFGITLKTPVNEKSFDLLSGGEQMAAALAVRIAIMELMCNVGFAFYDEPTVNLDADTRRRLAENIGGLLSERLHQIFVISHDETFESAADRVIRFDKDEFEITHVTY